MKRILYAVTKSNFGGAQRYVFELAEEAKHRGFEVSVACGGNGKLIDMLDHADIPVHNLSSAARDINLIKEFKTLIALYKILRKVKPDIVHLNSPKLGGLGSVVARLAGIKKIIYTNHGWPFMEDRSAWQKIIIRFFSWLTIIFCHRIIVLSKKEFDMVKNWPGVYMSDKSDNQIDSQLSGQKKSKLIIIRNGIRPYKVLEKDDALISLIGEAPAIELIKNNKRIIGNISELHKNKGYIYALNGLAQYKKHNPGPSKYHFIIVGDGDEQTKLKHIVHNLNLNEDVTFTGYIRDAREYIKAFDIFLLSSIKEGLPYAILEAGYAYVPVIATNVGGISEVIEHLQTGFLIAPANPKAIQDTLQYIDDHPGEGRQYADGLYQKISTELSFNLQAERTFSLY